ncbi:MAG: chemotaxis protein CheW [Myxococcota bacterium]
MTQQYCTFHLGDLFFGVDVQRVQEVIRYQEMTPVPLADPVIQGLINLRGQIVTAIEMRAQLAFGPRPADRRPMNVVLRTEDGAVSLLVDEIGDVLELDDAHYERAPATVRHVVGDLVPGVYKLEDRLMLVLDTDKTLKAVAAA